MRVLRIGMLMAVAIGVLGIDVGQSVRTGNLSVASARAAKHRHNKKHARKRHRKHHRRKAPASEM
jgi:uncharacterized membrane protein YoaK (UPF0700 family)